VRSGASFSSQKEYGSESISFRNFKYVWSHDVKKDYKFSIRNQKKKNKPQVVFSCYICLSCQDKILERNIFITWKLRSAFQNYFSTNLKLCIIVQT
jgi:hypothetical protein